MSKKNKSINDITQKNTYKEILKQKDKIFTSDFMKSKIKLWEEIDFMKNYPIQEQFLDKMFLNEFKSNKKETDVFIKVRILDSFYSTNLKEGLDDMVVNIVNNNLDISLRKGDKTIVEKISRVKSTLYDTKDCVSFASKYCSRYGKTKFPIYDKYVKQMLWLINKASKFYKPFSLEEIHKFSYVEYSKVIDAFIDKFNKQKTNEKINYKTFDCYIWTWAKEILYKLNKK